VRDTQVEPDIRNKVSEACLLDTWQGHFLSAVDELEPEGEYVHKGDIDL
jgi:hypothetical protein